MFIFQRVVFNRRCQLYRSPSIGVADCRRIFFCSSIENRAQKFNEMWPQNCVFVTAAHHVAERAAQGSGPPQFTRSLNGRSSISFAHANTTYRTKSCHRIGRRVQSCQPTCPFAASVPGVSFLMLTKIVQFELLQIRTLVPLDPSHPTSRIAPNMHCTPSTQSVREANMVNPPNTQSIPWLTATVSPPPYRFPSRHSSCGERR